MANKPKKRFISYVMEHGYGYARIKNIREIDNYYQRHYKYGQDSFRDAHYDSGYTVDEAQNGTYPTQVGF